MSAHDIIMGAAGNAGSTQATYVDDVFSTWLYTGNGSSQIIQNGIALGDSNAGGSALFDGAGDHLITPTNSAFDFGTGNFTIECFINTSVSGTFKAVFCPATSFSTSGFFLFIVRNDNTIALEQGDGTVLVKGTTNVANGNWHHVAVCRSGTTTRMFVNGVQEGTLNSDTYSYGVSSVGTYVGAYQATVYPFNGRISNLRIVKGTAVYTSNFTPPSAPLTAVSGTSLLLLQGDTPFIDSSSNAFTITRNGDVSANGFGPFTIAGTGKGGMVWIKWRFDGYSNSSHRLYDTVRGATKAIASDLTDAETTRSGGLTAFNNDGFSLGNFANENGSTAKYSSWTFRKQPKFFDVVTWTGNGASSRQIPHSLGSVPGCVMVKCISTADTNWVVAHRSLGTSNLQLNTTASAGKFSGGEIGALNSSTTFTVAENVGTSTVNANGQTYVAYLFAHNAGGFGATGTDNVISCGSFTTDGSGDATVNLGYEPQFVMFKLTNQPSNWEIRDTMRGFTVGESAGLLANTTGAEFSTSIPTITSTGFNIRWGAGFQGIYIAIRRPHKPPTSGTEVFAPVAYSGNGTFPRTITTGFPVDLTISSERNEGGWDKTVTDRVRGVFGGTSTPYILYTNSTTNSVSNSWGSVGRLDVQNGVVLFNGTSGSKNINNSSNTYVLWNFKRAPGFFDVVVSTDTAAGGVIKHNLGTAPELIIKKRVTNNSDWEVSGIGSSPLAGKLLYLNRNDVQIDSTRFQSYIDDKTEVFYNSTLEGVYYLFASLPGVSKVGTYTGNGTSQTINCGFTNGARFVLIKRTSGAGSWMVFDTARGIVSAEDPYLYIHNTQQENVYGPIDWVDPHPSGFSVVHPDADINGNGSTYLYLAIA